MCGRPRQTPPRTVRAGLRLNGAPTRRIRRSRGFIASKRRVGNADDAGRTRPIGNVTASTMPSALCARARKTAMSRRPSILQNYALWVGGLGMF